MINACFTYYYFSHSNMAYVMYCITPTARIKPKTARSIIMDKRPYLSGHGHLFDHDRCKWCRYKWSTLVLFCNHTCQSINTSTFQDLKDIVELFHKTLSSLPPGHSLVLFLDSLDQLDPSHGARQLSWLPRHLPPHVKIVVSTLPEPIYECFPRLQVA